MAFDPVTYVLAKSGAKVYTDAAIEAVSTNITYKGSVSSIDDLPSDAEKGDEYSITNLGMYVYDGEAWKSVSKAGPQGNQGEPGARGEQGPAGRDGAIQYHQGEGISIFFNETDGKWYIVNTKTGGGAWGEITGNLSEQTDLASALAGKADLENGKVPLGQLPSFVIADVIEVPTYDDLPETGQSGVVYYVTETGKSYRWVGNDYVEINNKANYYSIVISTDISTMGSLKSLIDNVNIAGEHVFLDLHDYIAEGYVCTVHFFTDSSDVVRCEINDILNDRMYGVGQTYTSSETITAYLAKTDARYDIKHVETADGQVLVNNRGSITLPESSIEVLISENIG